MKTNLSIIFLLSFLNLFSQDTAKINHINLLVSAINNSTISPQRDTIIQDHPELGLKMTTYLTMIANEKELLKYVNFVKTIRIENAVEKQITSSNTFYYYQNKLIKVEEYIIGGDEKHEMDWYYSDNKPLYYTLNSERAEERATQLLSMSQLMIKQIIKQPGN